MEETRLLAAEELSDKSSRTDQKRCTKSGNEFGAKNNIRRVKTSTVCVVWIVLVKVVPLNSQSSLHSSCLHCVFLVQTPSRNEPGKTTILSPCPLLQKTNSLKGDFA